MCSSFRNVHSIPLDKCLITCVHHDSLTQIMSWSWKLSRLRIFIVPPLKPTGIMDLSNLFYISYHIPRWLSGKESACWYRTSRWCGFNPWVRKIPWRKRWQPTPVSFPGKSMDRGEPGRLQPLGSQILRHNWAHIRTFTYTKKSYCKNPTFCSLFKWASFT